MRDNAVKILLIEDDEVDVMAIRRALKKKHIVNDLTLAKDGVEGLDILRGANGHQRLARPNIILLDLNMPRMGGLEFLHEIRGDPNLSDAIIFVLTTSNSDEDRCQAYSKNIAGYILKSKVGDELADAISMLNLYWAVVELPL